MMKNINIVIFMLSTGLSYTSAKEKINTEIVTQNLIENQDDTTNSESFHYDITDGWLKLELNQKVILYKLGEPKEKGKDIHWGALGTYVQKWSYPTKGIFLEMESNEQNGIKHVLMITITEPSNLSTSKMIKIGSDSVKVLKQYQSKISWEFSNDNSIVVGTIYGGVIFSLEEGKVKEIFIGAAAE